MRSQSKTVEGTSMFSDCEVSESFSKSPNHKVWFKPSSSANHVLSFSSTAIISLSFNRRMVESSSEVFPRISPLSYEAKPYWWSMLTSVMIEPEGTRHIHGSLSLRSYPNPPEPQCQTAFCSERIWFTSPSASVSNSEPFASRLIKGTCNTSKREESSIRLLWFSLIERTSDACIRPKPWEEAIVRDSLPSSVKNCKPESFAVMVWFNASSNCSSNGTYPFLDSSTPSIAKRIVVTFWPACCNVWAVCKSVNTAGAVVPASWPWFAMETTSWIKKDCSVRSMPSSERTNQPSSISSPLSISSSSASARFMTIIDRFEKRLASSSSNHVNPFEAEPMSASSWCSSANQGTFGSAIPSLVSTEAEMILPAWIESIESTFWFRSSSTMVVGISTTCPIVESYPEMTMSVEPHAASTSFLTVSSNESPTMRDELIMAEPIINPAIRRAAWRWRRRICCHASLNTRSLLGLSKACTPKRLKIPNMALPTKIVDEPRPSQSRTK